MPTHPRPSKNPAPSGLFLPGLICPPTTARSSSPSSTIRQCPPRQHKSIMRTKVDTGGQQISKARQGDGQIQGGRTKSRLGTEVNMGWESPHKRKRGVFFSLSFILFIFTCTCTNRSVYLLFSSPFPPLPELLALFSSHSSYQLHQAVGPWTPFLSRGGLVSSPRG
ncbi:hypothetical protein B0J18DRAFT_157693 [Chaetomium sp. MPI-SDFR-AT-0129]|nr:hypothetical protein B0J18DRAFT_157693 [Chaetomium sp. MPI-SDFR-AT-0129]